MGQSLGSLLSVCDSFVWMREQSEGCILLGGFRLS